jgi:uncharacterized protein YndB with AHSA1/START domain
MDAVADDRMLRMTRVFDAPRERVFAAWTDPEQFAEWFGPEGVTTIDCALDVRAGGTWRLLGRGAERRHAVSGKYLDVAPPERLRFTWAWHTNGDPAAPREHETIVTIEFKTVGRKTEMTLVHGPFLDGTGVANHNRGWTGSLGKLDRLLARST